MDKAYTSFSLFWDSSPLLYNLTVASALLPVLTLSLAWFWSLNNWSNHPMVSKLKLYARDGNWRQVGADFETEFRYQDQSNDTHTLQSFLCPKLAVPSFRRIDKISLRTSPLSRLIVTDSWVVVVGSYPWSFQLSHQSDVTLKIIDSEQHRISTEGHIGGAQYLHISINNRQRWHKNIFLIFCNCVCK